MIIVTCPKTLTAVESDSLNTFNQDTFESKCWKRKVWRRKRRAEDPAQGSSGEADLHHCPSVGEWKDSRAVKQIVPVSGASSSHRSEDGHMLAKNYSKQSSSSSFSFTASLLSFSYSLHPSLCPLLLSPPLSCVLLFLSTHSSLHLSLLTKSSPPPFLSSSEGGLLF